MGMNTSSMGGKGLSTSHVLSLVKDKLYKQFVEKDIKEFDQFHVAILDTFNTINMALPGKHYDAPSLKDVKDLFNQWKEANEEARMKRFTDFMNKNVNLNKVDESMIITALVAPPAAMVAKRTGQKVPQLKLMNAIPDVVFVPSATVLALIAVKILRLMFMGKTTSKDATGSHVDPVSSPSNIPPPPPAPEPKLLHSGSHVVPVSSANNIHPPPPAPEHVDHVSSANNIPPPPSAPEPKPLHSQNGFFCKLCNKVHEE